MRTLWVVPVGAVFLSATTLLVANQTGLAEVALGGTGVRTFHITKPLTCSDAAIGGYIPRTTAPAKPSSWRCWITANALTIDRQGNVWFAGGVHELTAQDLARPSSTP